MQTHPGQPFPGKLPAVDSTHVADGCQTTPFSPDVAEDDACHAACQLILNHDILNLDVKQKNRRTPHGYVCKNITNPIHDSDNILSRSLSRNQKKYNFIKNI